MTLIHRVSRLLSADAHALLDRLEDPQALLQQAIRDMEAAIAELEGRLRADRQQLERSTRLLQRKTTEDRAIDTELDLAFATGGTDADRLARPLLRRRLLLRQELAQLAERCQAQNLGIDESARQLADQQEHLEALREKSALFTPEPDTRPPASGAAVTEADIDLALLREKARRNPHV